jgi:hypothetical protein
MRALLRELTRSPPRKGQELTRLPTARAGCSATPIADIHLAMNLPDNVNVPWTGPAGESLFREVLAVIRNGPGTCRGAAGA